MERTDNAMFTSTGINPVGSMMNDIVLAAVNARYSHASLGARFLLDNSDPALTARTRFLEFSINDAPGAIAAAIVESTPAITGLGVYIWNRPIIDALIPLIRRDSPATRIVLGGPEITYDAGSPLAQASDCVIRGEGERLWPTVCTALLEGQPVPHLPAPEPPDLASVRIPVDTYSDHDLAHRNVYIEASRGCPLACSFCLSAIEAGVRYFPETEIQTALGRLLDRGALRFRFIDRSFNLGGRRAEALLRYLLDRVRPGLRLHFEMTPDGLHPGLRELLCRFPPGCLHIETGIQSFDPAVLTAVNRRTDVERQAEGIHWLIHEARADVHADLIAGLPHETPVGFAAGFDRLYRLGPAEIQVGMLKLLPGTPLRREAATLGLRYAPEPPYTVQETPTLTPDNLATVRRFAFHWDRVVNRGHFPRTVAMLLREAASPWDTFDRFSRLLADRHGLTGIPIEFLADTLLAFATESGTLSAADARAVLRDDYLSGGRRRHPPSCLR